MDPGPMVGLFVVSIPLAVVLFLIAAVGGGFSIKEIKIPKAPSWARLISLAVSVFLCALPFLIVLFLESMSGGGGGVTPTAITVKPDSGFQGDVNPTSVIQQTPTSTPFVEIPTMVGTTMVGNWDLSGQWDNAEGTTHFIFEYSYTDPDLGDVYTVEEHTASEQLIFEGLAGSIGDLVVVTGTEQMNFTDGSAYFTVVEGGRAIEGTVYNSVGAPLGSLKYYYSQFNY